jgi:hypothetical protein
MLPKPVLVCCTAFVRLWHEADIPRHLLFVRFRGKADIDHHVALTASVEFDPSGHTQARSRTATAFGPASRRCYAVACSLTPSSGLPYVSWHRSTAANVITAATMIRKAGLSSLPVRSISQVAASGLVPPIMATQIL